MLDNTTGSTTSNTGGPPAENTRSRTGASSTQAHSGTGTGTGTDQSQTSSTRSTYHVIQPEGDISQFVNDQSTIPEGDYIPMREA